MGWYFTTSSVFFGASSASTSGAVDTSSSLIVSQSPKAVTEVSLGVQVAHSGNGEPRHGSEQLCKQLVRVNAQLGTLGLAKCITVHGEGASEAQNRFLARRNARRVAPKGRFVPKARDGGVWRL